jgi:hypothetical protein
MAYYLVTAKLIHANRRELIDKLNSGEFLGLIPFGIEITKALTKSRAAEDGMAIWEEEDHCDPPLTEERVVLDKYFTNISVMRLSGKGSGWDKIKAMPRLLPESRIYSDPRENPLNS